MKKFFQKNKKYLIGGLAGLGSFWLIWSSTSLAATVEWPLPGLPAGATSDPGAYISYFFIFGLGLVGFLAVAAIVVGGIMYMTGGTIGKVEKAKSIIWGAITGVILLMCSYLLLYTIDPTLVNLSPFRPTPPGNIPAPAPRVGPASCDPNTQEWKPALQACGPKPLQSLAQCGQSIQYSCSHEVECNGAPCPTGTKWTQPPGQSILCACVRVCLPGQLNTRTNICVAP